MAKSDLTAERLREVLHYDPTTGIFTWRIKPKKGRTLPGQIAGHVSKRFGYALIKIAQVKYPAHRLAWLYITGEHPFDEIDHIDRNRSNNVFTNLRPATRKQNQENRNVSIFSVSGVHGVTWDKYHGRWLVRIKHCGVHKHIGYYDDLSDAIAARRNSEREHFTHSEACKPPI